jgi:hypothetical protein
MRHQHHRRHAAARIATALLALTCLQASGQTVYRCGNHYSDLPCTGASTLAIDDSRSAAQKAQTDAATVQARTLAREMERERHALEKSALTSRFSATSRQSDTRLGAPGTGASASTPMGKATKAAKKKNSEPPLFTAATPPDKKSKSTGGSAD